MRAAVRIAAVAGLSVACLAGATAAAVPAARHFASALWNDPTDLPALPGNPTIHYEPGAEDAARAVAALLPEAMATVEAAQGRPFAHPVTIGVYTSPAAFAAANGVGSTHVVGVALMGRLTLSPILFTTRKDRLRAILTHELSHTHLQGWMSSLAYLSLPTWFTEGLAVTVSNGGGAEGIDEAAARAAIAHGDRIAIPTQRSVFALTELRFEHPAAIDGGSARVLLAYKQAGLFVAWLRARDPVAFAGLLRAVISGRAFPDAFAVAYGGGPQVLWARFVGARAP